MQKITRMVGLGASVGIITLWGVFSFFNPDGYQGITAWTYVVIILMVLLAIVGIVGVLLDNARLMLAVFVPSFVPVGFYLLGTPGLFRWIGIFNLLFLLASLPGLLQGGDLLHFKRSSD